MAGFGNWWKEGDGLTGNERIVAGRRKEFLRSCRELSIGVQRRREGETEEERYAMNEVEDDGDVIAIPSEDESEVEGRFSKTLLINNSLKRLISNNSGGGENSDESYKQYLLINKHFTLLILLLFNTTLF